MDGELTGATINDVINDTVLRDFEIRRIARDRVNEIYRRYLDDLDDLNDQDKIDLEETIEDFKENPGDDSKFQFFIDSIRAKIALRITKYETKKEMRRWKKLELRVLYSLIKNRND